MKRGLFKASGSLIALAFAVLTVVPAFGQDTSRSITFSREATVGGQKVTQGKYTITFDKEKEGELAVLKDGREVAKSNYKLVPLGKDASDSAVIFVAAEDGSLLVRRIELKGLNVALQME
ncbi:MAG TPA: hypothetical protein VE262_09065 [Blastocatellia bacterium]|nr:hypothetical protein [Blastocatellia bacterium]